VQTEERAGEIMQLCNEHGWQVIVGIEPDKPEDISDIKRMTRSWAPLRPGPWSILKELLAYTDFVLYDIKHLDPGEHRRATGKDNRLILRNARRIFQSRPMRIRVPVIPGFNDSAEAVKAIARFVKTEWGPVAVDLLPYNKMGEGKYALLGRDSSSLEPQDERHMANLQGELHRELGAGFDQDA
jgi:hypothetical protein